MAELVGTVIGIVLLIVVILVSPLVTIWALNTLFSLQIAYGISTYLAALWLTGLITVGTRRKKT